MRKLRKQLTRSLLDILLSPLILLGAWAMLLVKRQGIQRMPIARSLFRRLGLFPVRHHYYEPFFNPRHLRRSLGEDRPLAGLDWNVEEQLSLLGQFHYGDELARFPVSTSAPLEYYYDNGSYRAGDAEYLYSIIRWFKPGRIIEIGSGYSTMMALNAIRQNQREDPQYQCEHLCIEPHETVLPEGITLLRREVQDVELSQFAAMQRNDILFVDSSHMIKPQGDVLYEMQEILPRLAPGVLVHFHDIFSPRDYPADWLLTRVRFWNEQYLLEAFLCFNSQFKILGALNFLRHHFPDQLTANFPVLKQQLTGAEPGAFWLQRL